MSTYFGVMSYGVCEPEIRQVYVVKAERFQENEYIA